MKTINASNNVRPCIAFDGWNPALSLRFIRLLLFSCLLVSSPALAQSIWNGGGADTNWTTGANWGGTAPVAGNALTFAGTTRPVTNNDFTAGTNFGNLLFTNTTAGQGFTLNGNAITLGGNITTSTLTGGVSSATILDTINLNLILSGTRTISTAASGTNGNHNLTINGLISETGGSFGLTKQGGSGGVLTLSNNANSFTGPVTLVSGTLSFSSIADPGTPSALGAGATIITASSAGTTGTLSYTGAGASTSRQIQIGTGGTLTSTVGLIIENAGTSGALVFSNPNFNVAAASFTAAKTLTLQGANTSNNQISGNIVNNSATGTIAITKSGSGVWALGGTNTYTGGTTVSAGVLTFLNTNARPVTGTTTVASGATLGLGVAASGSFFTSTDVDNLLAGTFAGVTNDAASRAGIDTTAGDFTYASSIPVTTRGLTKVGPNALTLTGVNNHSGGTFLLAGTLNANNASALGTGTFTIIGGTLDNTTAGPLTLSTNNNVAFSGSFTFGGTQDLNLGSGVVSIGGASRTLTLNNNRTLTTGQLQWSSDSDRTLTVSQGTGTGGKLVLSGFQLNVLTTATAVRTRTITGTGNVDITSAIVDGNTFANNLTYSGSGTLALSAANTYTGLTTVSGGVVRLDHASALPGGAGTTGGTSPLLFSGTSTSGGVIGLTVATGDFTRSIVGLTPGATQVGWTNGGWGGFAAFGGDRTVNFGGAVTPTSFSWSSSGGIFGGGLVLSDSTSDSTVTIANPINLSNAGGSRTVLVNNGSAGVDAIFSGILSGSTTRLIKTGAGTLALTATNTYSSSSAAGTPGTTISAGVLQIGNGGTTGSIATGGDIENNATLAFNRSNNFTVGSNITGTGVVNQIGTGTTTLTGASSYTGATNINSGGLQLGSGGTTGSLSPSSTITNNGTLIFNRNNALVQGTDFAAGISGTGGLTQAGTGTTTLSGTNSYSGTTTISGGVLEVGTISGGALGGGGLFFSGNAVLQGNGSFTRGFSSSATPAAGQVGGATGGFAAKDGTLTVNFGNNAATTFSFSSSSFRFGDNLVFGSASANSPVIVVNPISTNGTFVRTITVNSGTGGDYAELQGGISSTGSIVKAGPGLLILSAASTYSGATTISAGTLQLGSGAGGGAAGSIAGTSGITNNGILAVNRNNDLTISTLITGSGAVNQIGAGATTLTAANTYTGGTSVTNGTLLVNNTTGSGTGTGAVTTSTGTIFGGSGIIAPAGASGVTIGGVLAPGVPGVAAGIGTLSFTPVDGNVTFQSTASVNLQISGNGVNDLLSFNASGAGLIDFTALAPGSINVSFTGGYTPAPAHTFNLIDWSALTGPAVSGLSDSQLNLSTAGFDPSWFWDTSLFTSSGMVTISIVPEPSRLLLLATGLGMIFMRRRRAA